MTGRRICPPVRPAVPGQRGWNAYLDAFYEEADAYLPERLHLARLRQPDPGPLQLRLVCPFMRRMYRPMFSAWPEPIREQLINHHLSPQWGQAGVRERSTMAELGDELHRGGQVPDVPVIVLTALGIDPGMRLLMPPRALREMTDGNRRLYQALAGSVTHGWLRVLEDARHCTITTDRPDAVIQAILDLVGEAQQRPNGHETGHGNGTGRRLGR